MTEREMPVWMSILLDDPANTPVTTTWVHPISVLSAKPQSRSLVLIAHGSRDPRWREPFERLYATVRRTTSRTVKLAFMEFISPTLMEVAEECENQRISEIDILPIFMAGGAHVSTDIPEQAERVRERFPHMQVSILPPLGEDRRMFSLMCDIIREKLA